MWNFLGIQIVPYLFDYILHQQQYRLDILQWAGLAQAKSILNPLSSKVSHMAFLKEPFLMVISFTCSLVHFNTSLSLDKIYPLRWMNSLNIWIVSLMQIFKFEKNSLPCSRYFGFWLKYYSWSLKSICLLGFWLRSDPNFGYCSLLGTNLISWSSMKLNNGREFDNWSWI